MAIANGLVRAYAKAIYEHGSKKFSEIRPDYVEAVKQYATETYTQSEIDRALRLGYISQDEYDSTMSYKDKE